MNDANAHAGRANLPLLHLPAFVSTFLSIPLFELEAFHPCIPFHIVPLTMHQLR
jgi:hypothetical protein